MNLTVLSDFIYGIGIINYRICPNKSLGANYLSDPLERGGGVHLLNFYKFLS